MLSGDEEESKYFVEKQFDQHNQLHSLLFAHPEAFEIILLNPDVVAIDSTYKTNRFNMPFLHISGVTVIGTTYDIAYCFLPNEKEETYNWAVQSLRCLFEHLEVRPLLFITDNDTALKKALREYYPKMPQRLCIWHINKNVEKQAMAHWDVRRVSTEPEKDEIERQRHEFIQRWNELVARETEEAFEEAWESLQLDYRAYPRLIQYIRDERMPTAEQWAQCYCGYMKSFGYRTTSLLEARHKALKNHPRSTSTTSSGTYTT